jgi:hypothetical protein
MLVQNRSLEAHKRGRSTSMVRLTAVSAQGS